MLAWIRFSLPSPSKNSVAFFHPFAEGGGGGERVLWAAIQALQRESPDSELTIYCGEGWTPESLSIDAARRFNLTVAPTFRTVPLQSRDALRPERYPRLTMVLQALGSIRVAIEGLKQHVPEVWVDTTGWAFPYPLVRAAGGKVVAYVHYPTISTDMLSRVRERRSQYNNDDKISSSSIKSAIKLVYYKSFAVVYGLAISSANVVMVNSSWTRRHVAELWWKRGRPTVVYPPCDTKGLQLLPLDRRLKRVYIVSVAQFRPEKNHELQLRAFAAARAAASKTEEETVANAVLSARLQMIGSCRGPDDVARLDSLKALAKDLGLGEANVEFKVNVPFEELQKLLGDAVIGLHTMEDEHFGISVVEYMAAGVVPIAHGSGGPKEDIVIPEVDDRGGGGATLRTGYLCRTCEEYTDAIIEVLAMSQLERLEIADAGRRRAAQFSDERFAADFLDQMWAFLPSSPDR